jgi:hypothetical protein
MTTTLMSKKDQAARVGEFLQFLRQGVEMWVKAGEILVKLVEDDPKVFDLILQNDPHINARLLYKLEEIGRRRLHPLLALGGGAGCSALAKLPMSQQERYLKEPVALVVHTPQGKTDILQVRVQDMTPEQAKQVFDKDRVRTEGEQKAILMQAVSYAAGQKKQIKDTPWVIRGGKVEFREGVRMGAAELAAILAQLTK